MKALSKVIIIISIICIFTSLCSCSSSLKKENVNLKDVEHISVFDSPGDEKYRLSEEDAERFIELYNSASYEGKGTGEGGTAEFGAIVTFKDGSYMNILEFSGSQKRFKIVHKSGNKTTAWFYADNEELKKFILEKLQQFKEQK